MRRSWYFLVPALLVLAACGSVAADSDEVPDVAAACLEGAADCDDTLDPLPGEDSTPRTDGGGALGVDQLVDLVIDGPFAAEGFYVEDADGARLCSGLLESYPAQCGGAAIPFDNSAGVDLGQLEEAGGVTWSPSRIIVEGELVDGVFVASG